MRRQQQAIPLTPELARAFKRATVIGQQPGEPEPLPKPLQFLRAVGNTRGDVERMVKQVREAIELLPLEQRGELEQLLDEAQDLETTCDQLHARALAASAPDFRTSVKDMRESLLEIGVQAGVIAAEELERT